VELISHQPEKCEAVFGSADARKSAGAPLVAIDSDVTNTRARRAYAKAGFVETRLAPAPEGDVAVMVFQGANADR
jgi:hypothetical protein